MKNKKLRIIFAYLISVMPTNKLRCFLYRTIFDYNIYRSIIGRGTIIIVDNVNLTECHIGTYNKFIGPMNITVNKNASIGSMNIFNTGWWVLEKQFNNANYTRNVILEENSRIAVNHYIDITGSFTLSKNSRIAGNGSQFWTHGAGVQDRDIFIGENCYIGSAVRFAPGSSIGDNSLIGLGSVITKKFNSKNVLIAGQPAKIIRENYNWKTQENLPSQS